MAITGIVEDDDHPVSRRLLAQPPEKTLERRDVEDRTHYAHKLTGAQADGAEARHGFADRRMLQYGVPDFRDTHRRQREPICWKRHSSRLHSSTSAR